MSLEYAQESIWFDKWRYDDAECQYYEKQSGGGSALGTLASQIAKAREEIQNSLASGTRIAPSGSSPAAMNSEVVKRVSKLEEENDHLKQTVSDLEKTVLELTKRFSFIECGKPTVTVTKATPAPKKAPPPKEEDSDDDVDLFGSEDEEESAEAQKAREAVLKQYADKKSKKPGPIAKSSVLLDCKPWDDETDLKVMEKHIRSIEMDGLHWGAAKAVPLAYGINKLSILCTVEDEKVSIDDLAEKIQEFEDFVQSVDIAAFNKI